MSWSVRAAYVFYAQRALRMHKEAALAAAFLVGQVHCDPRRLQAKGDDDNDDAKKKHAVQKYNVPLICLVVVLLVVLLQRGQRLALAAGAESEAALALLDEHAVLAGAELVLIKVLELSVRAREACARTRATAVLLEHTTAPPQAHDMRLT